MNPVAAGLVAHPAEYRWSSARAHSVGITDILASPSPLQTMISDWEGFLRLSSDEELKTLKRHEKTGRPLGSVTFVEKMEQALGRTLSPQRPGPKKKN